MPEIQFLKIDKELRSATYLINGEEVTRKIPAQFDGTLEDYLNALVEGFKIEFLNVPVKEL